MLNPKNKIVRHTGIYLFGDILRRSVSLIMLPIYTRYLTPEDYGVVELLSMIIDLATIIFGARIAQAIFRFYCTAKSDSDKNNVIASALFLAVLLNGIGASGHISTLLNEENLRGSWLVLTMTLKHRNKILQLNPASASKVYTLSEYAGFNNDVADPFGKDIEYYKNTFEEINEKVKIIFEKIKEER